MNWLKILLILLINSPVFYSSNISSICGNLSPKCKCSDHILDCSQAKLTNLDRVIETSSADQSIFKIVNFSFNDLQVLNHSFTAPFHEAEFFDFSHNNLHSLENHNFVHNPNLKYLNLSHNSLHEMKKGQFSGLDSNLRELNLSFNLLTNLESNTFFHLRNLENLDLRWNNLNFIENGAFKSLASLKVLNLDNNDLATVSLRILTKLETLSLIDNNLKDLPVFDNNNNLRNLFLDGNSIEVIKTNSLLSASHITQISLKNMNKLKSMEKCAFCGLSELRKLVLRKNRLLTKIGSLAFGTGPLTEIDLSENHLSILPFDLIFWNDEHKVKVNMSGNPWNCDCRMKWILKDGFRDMIEDEPRCSTPKQLRGRNLKNLTDADFDVQKCSTADDAKKIVARNRQPSFPKLFLSLAAVLLIAASILILWILVWRRRKTIVANPLQAAKMKSKKKAEPYAYRNLVMMQEDLERQEKTATSATPEEEDLVMNAARLALEKTSGV